jgi:hypothetical protein
MCIVAYEADVSKTKIFTGPLSQEKQLVIYENKVSTNMNNVMILPVPFINLNSNSIEDEVKFIDMSKHEGFFEVMDSFFHENSLYNSKGLTYSTNGSLEVHEVGSYRASKVPDINSFDNLNSNVFKIPDECLNVLKENYSNGFGFIVCQLRPGSFKYEPFAYTCKINSSRLFIPTMHLHHGHKETISHWDHSIYFFDSKVHYHNNTRVIMYPNHLKQLDNIVNSLSESFKINSKIINKLGIHGHQPNNDVLITVR